jgi:hypothetical protein
MLMKIQMTMETSMSSETLVFCCDTTLCLNSEDFISQLAEVPHIGGVTLAEINDEAALTLILKMLRCMMNLFHFRS